MMMTIDPMYQAFECAKAVVAEHAGYGTNLHIEGTDGHETFVTSYSSMKSRGLMRWWNGDTHVEYLQLPKINEHLFTMQDVPKYVRLMMLICQLELFSRYYVLNDQYHKTTATTLAGAIIKSYGVVLDDFNVGTSEVIPFQSAKEQLETAMQDVESTYKILPNTGYKLIAKEGAVPEGGYYLTKSAALIDQMNALCRRAFELCYPSSPNLEATRELGTLLHEMDTFGQTWLRNRDRSRQQQEIGSTFALTSVPGGENEEDV